MKTIDMTPTWESLLPVMLAVLENGSLESKRDIRSELQRMAHAADLQVKLEKDRNLSWATDNYPPKWMRPVLLALVKAILKRGHSVSIWLGDDELVIERSTDLPEIIKNLASEFWNMLMIDDDLGWFSLIYDNGPEHDPMVVISDYSDNNLCNEIISDIEEGLES